MAFNIEANWIEVHFSGKVRDQWVDAEMLQHGVRITWSAAQVP